MTGKELEYISEAHRSGLFSGDGQFTRSCHEWLENKIGTKKTIVFTPRPCHRATCTYQDNRRRFQNN